MKALVTGGAGFIGHHLVSALLERGDDVVVVDDLSTGMRSRLEPYADRIDIIEGSILDARVLDQASSSCEVVFHLAAIPSVERSLTDPVRSNDANVTGTIRVMLAAERAGVRRFIYASSSSVYGVPAELPCRESMCPSPESPYGVSKLAAEQYVHVLGRHKGVETVSLRYFNVFGPSQDPMSPYSAVIPKFITAVLAGRRPTINGSGDTTRDFTFVDNVVRGNLLASTAAITSGSTYNIACGARTSLLELLATICTIAGQEAKPSHGPPRPGDILHSQADISKARLELGYEVQTPFAQGMELTVSWYAARTARRDHRA